MPLWHTPRTRQSDDTGKFHRTARMGTMRSAIGKHRNWSYHFVLHQTGTSVRRDSYSVTISDPFGNQVEYLAGFATPSHAGIAARQWIDAILEKRSCEL